MEERIIPMRGNAIVCTDSSIPTVRNEDQVLDVEQQGYYPTHDRERMDKFIEEIIAAAKDDRMNTKRAISADIAATARVQNQNERYMTACERELHRKDLPEERRKEILDRMETITASSERASAESRQFQQDQLNHSHKMPWKLVGIGAVILIGGLGGVALLRAA